MDVKSYWARARSKPPAVLLVLSASLGAIAAFIPTAAAQQARTEAQDRTRLLELQRQAVTQLQQAARPGAPADQVRRALLDASRSLDALGAGPDPGTAPRNNASTGRVSTRRCEPSLAAPRPTLRALASGDVRAVASATGPVLALLENVRAQLEGDVALGLPFQGSYSADQAQGSCVRGPRVGDGSRAGEHAIARRRRTRAGHV